MWSEGGVRCICCYATLIVVPSSHKDIAVQTPVRAPTVGVWCVGVLMCVWCVVCGCVVCGVRGVCGVWVW